MKTDADKIVLDAKITCPECGFSTVETMPSDACLWFYEYTSCGVVMTLKQGDFCVFCSYANLPCPPIQASGSCC